MTKVSASVVTGFAHRFGQDIARGMRAVTTRARALAGDKGSTGRSRATALSVIVAAHLGLLLWFDQDRPRPVPVGPMIMEVTLFPGLGVQSPITNTPTPDAGIETEGEQLQEPDTEAAPEDPLTEPLEAEATEAPDAATETTQAEDATTEADDSAAILAMVEAITGATSATVAEAPPTSTAAVAPAFVASQAGMSGGGCGIDADLAARLSEDPVAQAALASAPRDARSVANAIHLWDGDWVPVAARGGDLAFKPVRDTVAAAVRDAPPRCRDQINQGPRFLVIAERTGVTTVLVVGSGSWRWADLSPEPTPALFRWFGFGDRR